MPNLKPIFNYYLESKKGKEMVNLFDTFFASNDASASGLFLLDPKRLTAYDSDAQLQYAYDSVKYLVPTKSLTSVEDCINCFTNIFNKQVYQYSSKKDQNQEMKDLAASIIPISLALSKIGELFFPVLHETNFNEFRSICEYLGIKLPDPPYWNVHKKRCFYYLDICEALYKFSKDYSLSKSQTCAIIYGLVPEILSETKNDALPSPTRIWFAVASPEDQAAGGALAEGYDTCVWEVSEYTKRGDIIVMYGRDPMKAIHSIWRAATDGSNNPFSYFARRCVITKRQDIPLIPIRELRNDAVFGSFPRLNSDFAGIGGSELPYYYYEAILRMLEAKGFATNGLPTIEAPEFDSDENFVLEAEVSSERVIPLIERLGYSMNTKDGEWERETVLKLGRDRSTEEEAKKGRPDFAFYVHKGTLGQKSSPLVIECKFHMRNAKEQTEALAQGVSYARIMNAHVVVICDKIRIKVFQSDTFEFDEKRDLKFNHTWEELNGNNLLFSELSKLIGKNAIEKLLNTRKR